MSPAEQAAYNEQAAELAQLAKLQDIYKARVKQALNFAGKEDSAAWNGLFLMGLAMASLELIPFSCEIKPQPYWMMAPAPKCDCADWAISWMVESDTFHRCYDECG